MKEEFKNFVRKKPELISYVNNGSMTWQKFYEQWNLYGEDEKYWNNYRKNDDIKNESNETNNTSKKNNESFNFSNISDIIKKIDINQVQKGVNSLQKIVELLQGFSAGSASKTNTNSYKPRQLFKKFED